MALRSAVSLDGTLSFAGRAAPASGVTSPGFLLIGMGKTILVLDARRCGATL
jgi:hypothetical protein